METLNLSIKSDLFVNDLPYYDCILLLMTDIEIIITPLCSNDVYL